MSRVSTIRDSILPLLTFDANLRQLVDIIPSLSIRVRKALLHICQTGTEFGEKESWDQKLEDLCHYDAFTSSSTSQRLMYEDVQRFAQTTNMFPVYRSFVSMLVRAEGYTGHCGFEEVLRERINKEILCSQRKKGPADLDYTSLFNDYERSSSYSPFYPLTPSWHSNASKLASRLITRLTRQGMIYPRVQRRKNMSRETCRLLAADGYTHPDFEEKNLRTLDLELHRARTGKKICGCCEMRYAWKFVDLQPRCYYCIGGAMYWPSRYTRQIAVCMMEVLPTSRVAKRSDPTLLSSDLEDDDYICVWDFETFTTDLAELKFFLYWTSRSIEDQNCEGIKVLDYATGVEHLTLHEILDEYNDAVNDSALYTMYRVADAFIDAPNDPHLHLEQKNSGMLGVPGNIGFSTAQHAFHVSPATKEITSAVILGDDGLAVVSEDPALRFIPHLNIIGSAHPDKADNLPPLTEWRAVTKFVKRRMTRTSYGLEIDRLEFFPNLAPVFGIQDDFHTVRDNTKAEIILKFISQVGAYLWSIFQYGYLDDNERTLIRMILCYCYKRLHLPFNGSLPGYCHEWIDGYMPLCVPPLNYSYETEDWSEVVWERSTMRFMRLPLEGDYGFHSFEYIGQEVVLSQSPLVQVLVDLGCLKREHLMTEMVEVAETNKRRFQSMFTRPSPKTYTYRYIDIPPSWFSDLIRGPYNPYVE